LRLNQMQARIIVLGKKFTDELVSSLRRLFSASAH